MVNHRADVKPIFSICITMWQMLLPLGVMEDVIGIGYVIVYWHTNKLGKHQPNIGITFANTNINHYQNYKCKHFPIHFGIPRLLRKTFSPDLKKLTAVSESLSLC